MKDIFEKLYDELGEIIKIDEIAYLTFQDGKLNAVYKRDSKLFTNEEWVEFHKKNHTFVKNVPLLKKLIQTKQRCVVEDTNELQSKPPKLKKFNIESIYLFPIIKKNDVVGFINIVYIDNCCKLTKEQLDKCEKIIDKYKALIA